MSSYCRNHRSRLAIATATAVLVSTALACSSDDGGGGAVRGGGGSAAARDGSSSSGGSGAASGGFSGSASGAAGNSGSDRPPAAAGGPGAVAISDGSTGGQGADASSETGGGAAGSGGAARSDASENGSPGSGAVDGGVRREEGGVSGRESGAATAYNPCPPPGQPCTIMPFGDSITDGFTVRGGYRIPFFQGAHREGKQFTFVGSATNGPAMVDGVAFPQRHEGHSAHTMYDAPNAPIPRLGIARYVATSIPQFHPDIVLLMIGTNDVDGQVDLVNAPNRLGMLIDSIIALDAHTLIVVAQITPTMQDPLNQAIVTFNAGIPAVVKARADAGKHVELVDMYNAFVKDPAYKSSYLADRLHPNTAGYQVMSDVWNTVVHDLLR